jgi:hypothetical protein
MHVVAHRSQSGRWLSQLSGRGHDPEAVDVGGGCGASQLTRALARRGPYGGARFWTKRGKVEVRGVQERRPQRPCESAGTGSGNAGGGDRSLRVPNGTNLRLG